MSWVKIDDGILNNRKVIAVSKDAKLLYIAGLCFCSANLSDGVIPAKTVNVIAAQCEIRSAAKLVKELVREGLWIDNGDEYQVHDYLEHNESSESVRSKQEAARARMRRNRSQDVRANNQRTVSEVREPDTDTDTDTDVEQKTPKPPKAKSAKAKPPEPPAPNGTADVDTPFALFESMCEQTGVEPAEVSKADKNKNLAVAKRLAESGTTAKDVASITRWLKSQDWRTSGVDMFTVEKERMRWLTAGKPDGAKPTPLRKPPANLQTNKERDDKSVWLGDWPEYTG